MNWYERMNKAIEYIEENLDDTIDFDKISKIMCQSAVSFQRTFSIITDMSIFEYIRRRRLTLAAFELQNSKAKVIDVALKYGYDSPEAFARAFKEIHGTSPKMARQESVLLNSFPRITFLLTLKGDVAMHYKIESKNAFTVYGIEKVFSTTEEEQMNGIPNFWQSSSENGSIESLKKSTNDLKSGVHALCCYRNTDTNTFPYMLFAYKTKESNTSGYKEVEVPTATWAIFKTEKHTQEQTSSVIQSLVKRVYTDWLPTASYKKIDGYELELYFETDDGMYYCETWIRVVPK